MKKVLCNKDGKFLSIHDGDCTLTELNDGDCLTHEDGTIMIYRERKCKEDISKAFYHVYLRNNELHFLKTGMSFSYYDFIPSFRFSTEEENESGNLRYKNLNYFHTKEEAYTKLFAVKSVLND